MTMADVLNELNRVSPIPQGLYNLPATQADATQVAPGAQALAATGVKAVGAVGEPKPGRRPLSRKARAFLELLIAGKKTLEAYELAGFKGNNHAAYQLRSDLRAHLSEMLEAHGVSREDIKIELLKILQLPMNQNAVNVDTKLKLLKFMDKLTENEVPDRPRITPFLLNIQEPKTVNIHEAK